MPELPEVETVRRGLEALIVGKTVHHVAVRLARIVRTPSVEEFCRRLRGATVHAIGRRGKYLLVDFSDQVLVSHLRMEGRYGFYSSSEPVEPHTHVIFAFTDKMELRYRDVRQFGTMDLVATADLERLPGLSRLGLEPLDEACDVKYLARCFEKRRAPVKAVLLDQTVIAGLGNIYVDEILFLAQVHPEREAVGLNEKEREALVLAMRSTTEKAIAMGGSSIKSYVNGYGVPGSFQCALNVYGRGGEPCVKCGTTIEKSRVAGRGTHVCPKCQSLPETQGPQRSVVRGDMEAGLK